MNEKTHGKPICHTSATLDTRIKSLLWDALKDGAGLSGLIKFLEPITLLALFAIRTLEVEKKYDEDNQSGDIIFDPGLNALYDILEYIRSIKELAAKLIAVHRFSISFEDSRDLVAEIKSLLTPTENDTLESIKEAMGMNDTQEPENLRESA